MRKPHGYGVEVDRVTGKIIKEHDTFQCVRCNRHVIVPPFCDPATLGGICAKTGALICDRCVKREAVTFEHRVGTLEKAIERLRFSDKNLTPEEYNLILLDREN